MKAGRGFDRGQLLKSSRAAADTYLTAVRGSGLCLASTETSGGTLNANARLRTLIATFGLVAFAIALSAAPAPAQGVPATCTVKGTSGDDQLAGTKKKDVICGRGGNDTLSGRGNNDEIRGGAGNDQLAGGGGADRLLGEDGNDSLQGGAGNDPLDGAAGNDTLDGGDGADLLSGGDGDDRVGGAAGTDRILGGYGNDLVDAGSEADVVEGEDGTDTIVGGSGDDRLGASTGDDRIFGGDGNDWLSGGEGDDRLDGQAGADHVDGGPGLNICVPGGPADVLADNCIDRKPPTITSVEVSPTAIDTSLDPGEVLLRVRGDDDLSGLDAATLWFVPPGKDYATTWSLQPYNGSDPDLRGTLWGYVYLGQSTGSGDWDLIAASAKDRAGNEVKIDRDALDAIGAPKSFHQFGDLDETPPELLSMSVSPRSIDTSAGPARVTVTMELADAQSGIGQASVGFEMPGVTISPDSVLVSGTRQRGTWRATYAVPRWTPEGEIPLDIQLYDRAGNFTRADGGSVQQTGDGDSTAPALGDMQITPQIVNTVGSDQTVNLRFRVQDAQAGASWGAGLGSVMVMLQGPGGSYGLHLMMAFPEPAGTAKDRWWTASYEVPRFSAAGTWSILSVTLTDDVGNARTLQASELTSRGFPTSFSNQPG